MLLLFPNDSSHGGDFLGEYAAWSTLLFAQSGDKKKAYLLNPFEIDARAVEKALQKVFEKDANKKRFARLVANFKEKNAFNLLGKDKDARDLGKAFLKEFNQAFNKLEAEFKKTFPRKKK
jgi:hypothetical protein